MVTCLFVSFFVMLVIGIPVSVALALASTFSMLFFSNFTLDIIVQKFYSASDSFPLVAIPFFVLAGSIMSKGGMSDRLIKLALSMVGNVRGGLAMVSIVACMLFASISGSTAATTAAIGTVLIPAIIKTGFSRGSTTALMSTAGSIGIIIPPSIPFVLLGVLSGISIGDLFLGGVFSGILIGLSLMAVVHFIARIQHHQPSGEKIHLLNIFKSFKRAILSLLTVIFIMGGILFGWVTPTEAAIVAVVWSFVVCMFVYRNVKFSDLPPMLADAAKITGIVVLCIGASAPFAWLMTVEQIPSRIAGGMLSLTSSPIILKLMMIFILLVIGTFLDLTPAMILLLPIFIPVAKGIGMPLVQFGVMMVMALGIGQSTPPVGISLFVACGIAKTKVGEVIIPLIPYLLAMIFALLVAAYWSPLTMWLPSICMGSK